MTFHAIAVYFALITLSLAITPPDVQKHIDNLGKYADEKKWDKVEAEYSKINWLKVENPTETIRAISGKLKGSASIRETRKELKTKYNLLKEKGEQELSDSIEPIYIPTVEISYLTLQTVSIPMYRAVLAMMQLWEKRYSQEQEYYTGSGKRLPVIGTALWHERESARKSNKDGAWDKYNERIQNAIKREEHLQRRR